MKFIRFLRRNGAAVLFTAVVFALTFITAYNFRVNKVSDYFYHTLWALQLTPQTILSSFYDGSEHLWHICVNFLYNHGMTDMWAASAVVTAAADAAAYFIVFKFFDEALPEKFIRTLLAALVCCGFVVNAIVLPGMDFYSSVGAVNTWHNPTNIMVRPFAAAVLYMTVRIYNRRRYNRHALVVGADVQHEYFAFDSSFFAQFRVPVFTKAELILYPLCLLLSAYAKPSFLQFFAPTIFLFLVIDVIRTRGRLLPFCIKMALAFIPAGIICLSQFSSFFSGMFTSAAETAAAVETAAETSSAGVSVYFIKESFTDAGDFILTFLQKLWLLIRLIAFPLFIFLITPQKSLHDSCGRLSVLQCLVAWMESLCLQETGSRSWHGNFSWGFYLSTWLLWCSGLMRYCTLLQKKDRAGKIALYAGTPLLVWHLTSGIIYIIRILQTVDYYF